MNVDTVVADYKRMQQRFVNEFNDLFMFDGIAGFSEADLDEYGTFAREWRALILIELVGVRKISHAQLTQLVPTNIVSLDDAARLFATAYAARVRILVGCSQ